MMIMAMYTYDYYNCTDKDESDAVDNEFNIKEDGSNGHDGDLWLVMMMIMMKITTIIAVVTVIIMMRCN